VWPPDYGAERRHAAFAWHDLARFAPDVVHVNLPDTLPREPRGDTAVVATVHHPRVPRLHAMYAAAPRARRVAISRRQASLAPELAPMTVIHHGLDVRAYEAGDGAGGYVAFLGRIGPEKAPHLAIDAAVAAGVPLVIGGPHWSGDAGYDAYFEREMRPRLGRHEARVRWDGELAHAAKVGLLREAAALLMPSGWEEPFGLVMVEAMLTGTPVVALASGSAPEIVDDGITGFLVSDTQAMAAAIPLARRLDRRRCRAHARRRFGAARMADDYEALYRACVAVAPQPSV
jgi:glycosyltransferase involved in cell wall biosynthesis